MIITNIYCVSFTAGATPVDPKQNGKPATVKQGS